MRYRYTFLKTQSISVEVDGELNFSDAQQLANDGDGTIETSDIILVSVELIDEIAKV